MWLEGTRTSKERVRRLMRAHALQAPHRTGHAHGPKAHDGTITTADRGAAMTSKPVALLLADLWVGSQSDAFDNALAEYWRRPTGVQGAVTMLRPAAGAIQPFLLWG